MAPSNTPQAPANTAANTQPAIVGPSGTLQAPANAVPSNMPQALPNTVANTGASQDSPCSQNSLPVNPLPISQGGKEGTSSSAAGGQAVPAENPTDRRMKAASYTPVPPGDMYSDGTYWKRLACNDHAHQLLCAFILWRLNLAS